jgi:[ribosomal protein S5]-alanine N-acetyltransferase
MTFTELPVVTDRLILREPTLDDVDDLVAAIGHPLVAATTLNIPHPYTRETALEFSTALRERNRAGTGIAASIALRDENRVIGGIGLRFGAHGWFGELGYWVAVPCWGRGYATEAARRMIAIGFAQDALGLIEATYFVGNPASRRVMEKAGMTYEATLRQRVRKHDGPVDVGVCSITRAEWQAQAGPGQKTPPGD